MKNRFFYSILMSLLLLTGCYRDEFDQIEKEIKNLQDSQIATLAQQLEGIQKSHAELNVLSDELKMYVARIEEASDGLERNIAEVNQKILELRQSLSDKNSEAKGEALARLENMKAYLENQLITMKSTVEALKDKYDGIQVQIESMEALVADKYATTDWVNGTFATLKQQDSLISEVTAVRVLCQQLDSTTVKSELDINKYVGELRKSTLEFLDSSIEAKVNEIISDYEEAIGNVKTDVKNAFTSEIKSAIEKSENGIKSWVNEALNDYVKIVEADTRLGYYKERIGSVPNGASLLSQIDELKELIISLKSEIESAYESAIKKAIEESEGKLTADLTAEIENLKLNELKALTDNVNLIGADVTTLWDDLGKLEERIKTLEQEVAAINNSLAVILGDLAPTLEEYLSALEEDLKDNDNASAAFLKKLVEDLQYAVDGNGNENSLQKNIEDIEKLLGIIPEGEKDLVTWVQKSTEAIMVQLNSYATITYVDKLRAEIDSAANSHTSRLIVVSQRLSSAIDDSRDTICTWISKALKEYMRGADFDGKLKALESTYNDLFYKGDQFLVDSINSLGESAKTLIADLQEAYKKKIESSIEDFNGFVTSSIDTVYTRIDNLLREDSLEFNNLEATIAGMKRDVKALNANIDTLRDIVDSLATFVTEGGYTSLKKIVKDFDTELNSLDGTYANLSEFNTKYNLVNGTDGYKASIDSLKQFKEDLEAAEAAIANYKNLAKDFDLDGETLKAQFEALKTYLNELKTAVFGGNLRTQLDAIMAKDSVLANTITSLNSTLLSRLKSYTSIAFRPDDSNDGYASFTFDGDSVRSTLKFDVRPKELSNAIAEVASIKYVSSPTKSLVDFIDVAAKINSDTQGVLEAKIALPGSYITTISSGISLALFAQDEENGKFDFVSDFIPVSGDLMFTDESVFYVIGTGTLNKPLTVKVFYPTGSSNLAYSTEANWIRIDKGSTQPDNFNLSSTKYSISVNASDQPTSERSSDITFSVGSGRNKLSCKVKIVQAPREKQEFTKFVPADKKITFSWKGELIDTLTNRPYDPVKTAQEIKVTTSDGLSDWSVKNDTTKWAKVTKTDNKATLEFVPGTGNANRNQTGFDQIGSIIFTNATKTVDSTYTFTLLARPQQRLEFTKVDSLGHGKTEERNGQIFTVRSSDGEYDWESPETTGTNNWIHHKVDKSVIPSKVTVWTDKNRDTTARTGYISFTTHTGMNDTTYLYPIHQKAAPKQMFIFSPRNEIFAQNCYLGEDGLIHVNYKSNDELIVYVKGIPNDDDWTMTVNEAGTGNWLSRDEFSDKSGRKAASQAPDGFNYYIQLSVDRNNDETEREASIRFTCDSLNYDYRVIQDPKNADINGFNPVSGTIEFYWDGRVIGDNGKPTSDRYKDVEVTTGNASTDWTVEKASDLTWATVTKGSFSTLTSGLLLEEVRISDVQEYKDTVNNRIGTLNFTSKTNKTYTYKFTQLKAAKTTATVTIGGNEVDKLIINWKGDKYKVSDIDNQWKDITTYRVSNVQTFLATVNIEDGTNWDAYLDQTKTSSGWDLNAAKVSYSNKDYLGLTKYGTNQNDSPRTAEIVISNGLGAICRIPVVQEVRPAQSFTFNPELTFSDFKSGSITTTVGSDPALDNDEWNVNDETIGGWLTVKRGTVSRWPYGPTEKVTLTATQNNSPEPRTAKLVITYDGGTAEYAVTQPGREPQTFERFIPASGTVYFSWDGYLIGSDGEPTKDKYQDISVETNDDLNDWSVETTNTPWATVEHRTGQNANKARVSVQENKDKSERTGKLTFTSETGETETYTFSQEAYPGLSVSVSPDYVEIVREYNSSKRKYRTSPDGGWEDVKKTNNKYQIKLTVTTVGGGYNDWDIEYKNPDWASVTRDNGVIYIKPENVRNDKVQQKDSIIFKDKAGNLLTTYYYYKEARPAQTFTDPTEGQVFEYEFIEQTNKSITVTTSDGLKDWKLVQPSETWLTVSKKDDGSGLNVGIDANDGSERTATVKLLPFDEAASGARTFTIKQKAHEEDITVSFNETSWNPGWKGGSTTVGVTPSVAGYTDWNVEVSSDGAGWLTATKNAGSTGVDLVAAKQPNKGSVSRSATVSFTNGQGTNTITVTQDARGAQTISSVSPSSFTFSANGTKYSTDGTNWNNAPASVTVTTDDGETDWSVASSTWTPAPSQDGATLSFGSPSAVITWLDSKPTGTTTVTSYDGGSSQNITITQNRPLTVTLSDGTTEKLVQTSLTSRASFEFSIKSDTKYKVSNVGSSEAYKAKTSDVSDGKYTDKSSINIGFSWSLITNGKNHIVTVENYEGDKYNIVASCTRTGKLPSYKYFITVKVAKVN